MNYKALWENYFAEGLGIVAATAVAVVTVYSFIDPKQGKVDRVEANLHQAEKALEASLLAEQEAEQLLNKAQSTISVLQDSTADEDELEQRGGARF